MLLLLLSSLVQSDLRELQLRSGELQRREADVASSQSRLEAAAAAVARERQAVARERAQLQVGSPDMCIQQLVCAWCCAHCPNNGIMNK
jgi:hypothetical protein